MKPGDRLIVIDKDDERHLQQCDFIMMDYQGALCVEFDDGTYAEYDPFQLELFGMTTGDIMAPWGSDAALVELKNSWHYEPDPTKIIPTGDDGRYYVSPKEQTDGTK